MTERLFAFPWRPASFAAGGMQQMRQVPTEPIDPIPFTSNVSSGRALARLGPGAIVPAGTILGHLERALPGGQARLGFAITPSGKGARAIDPIPIIDSWRLAAQAGELSAAATSPLMIAENRNPSAGYVLMLSDAALRRRLLADRAIGLTGCGRFEIQAGLVPRRILVAIAYLAAQRLAPEITGIKCALPPKAPTPASISIAGLNGKPVAGNERQGSRGDRAIRALLAMPADLQPSRIITAISYPNQPQVLSLPDHRTAIELDYSAQTPYSTLNAGAWGQLEARLSLLSDPAVSASPSLSSVRVQSPRALLKAENSLLTQ